MLVLSYYGGLNEHEVAAAMGIRPGTVKSRLHRARHALRTHSHAITGRRRWHPFAARRHGPSPTPRRKGASDAWTNAAHRISTPASEQEDARLTSLLSETLAEQAGRAAPAPDALVRLNAQLDARESARPWWAGHLRLAGALAVALLLLALITPIRHFAAAGVHNAAQAVVTTITNVRDFATGGGSDKPTPTAKPPGTPAATGAVNGSVGRDLTNGQQHEPTGTTVTGSATRTGTSAPGTATGTTSGTAAGTAIPTPRATATIPGGQTDPPPPQRQLRQQPTCPMRRRPRQ